jgi:hypothetical protein
VTTTVTLDQGSYGSPLTVTQTGIVAPASAGANGIVVAAGTKNGQITNDGHVSGGNGSGSVVGGGIGVDMAASASLANAGTITGGTASYSGKTVGVGGIAVDLTSGGKVSNSGLITGGLGGSSPVATGGNGGIGVSLHGAIALSNTGTIVGGAGAYFSGGDNGYRFSCGSGGVGVYMSGTGTITNAGTILGGQSGRESIYARAGAGGAGVDLAAGKFVNDGDITGGSGGYSTYYPGGAGGSGIIVGKGVLTNAGTITGGAAGGCRYGTAGNGGTGVTLDAGTVTNTGLITGGVGGDTYYGIPGNGGAGVALLGGTLVTSGTIVGGVGLKAQQAVSFGTSKATLVIDPGAVFVGTVAANAKDTLVLGGTAGNTAGTLTGGLGTQFTGFANVMVQSGASWTLDSANVLGATSTVTDSGTLSVAGTLTDSGLVDVSKTGALNVHGAGVAEVQSVSLAGGAVTGDAKGAIAVGSTAGAAGAITIDAGASLTGFGTIGGAAIVNNGSIVAQGGTLTLATALTGAASGAVIINSGAVLVAEASVSGNQITFGGPAKLILAQPTQFSSTIGSFGSGDVIDAKNIDANGLAFSGGTLSLELNGTVLDMLSFSGNYTAADFGLTSDGNGGTDISFVSSSTTPASIGGVSPEHSASALDVPLTLPHFA